MIDHQTSRPWTVQLWHQHGTRRERRVSIPEAYRADQRTRRLHDWMSDDDRAKAVAHGGPARLRLRMTERSGFETRHANGAHGSGWPGRSWSAQASDGGRAGIAMSP
jgi:hypothetical protein